MSKIAIITRTKDRPAFLRRALQSVADQTFKDYVHVVVNDGGDPGFVDESITAIDEDSRQKVRVFHREESSNAPDTIFNESIDRVESEYVAVHDDDDTWHPDFLSEVVKVLDSGAAGVVVRTDKIVEEASDEGIRFISKSHYMEDVRAINLYRQCIDNQLTPISFAYRRAAYEEIGKYDSSLPVVGDWEFGIRFLQRFDVDYIDPGFALANYHHRKNGVNSFAKHNHRTYLNRVCNKYLRKDLTSGRIGIGYIMNDLRYQQDMMASVAKKLAPSFITNIIRRRVR